MKTHSVVKCLCRLRRHGAFLAAVSLLAFTGLLKGSERTQVVDPICGQNALYALLLLKGHTNLTYEEVLKMPSTPSGVTLLDLRDTARRFGLESEIRRYRPEEIDKMPLPSIVHLNFPSGANTTNHYVVAYRNDREHIHVIDGTTGEEIAWSRKKLFRWTGYALIPKETDPKGYWLIAGIVVILFLNFIIIRHELLRRKEA
jgi:hypothetical protein